MATGLKIPITVDKAGGASVESNSQFQLGKILFVALSEGGDDNPFQSLGLRPNLIFKIKDASFRGAALREVERVLAQFSDRVQLLPDQPPTFDENTEGEVVLSFKYIDLETNTVEEFSSSFSR